MKLHKLKIDNGLFLDELFLQGVTSYKVEQGDLDACLTLEMDVTILKNEFEPRNQKKSGKRLTVEKWIDLQKRGIKLCDRSIPEIPQVICIGVLQEDGTIKSEPRLVSASEWKNFQESWRRISGQKNPECKDYRPPQFFLFCE